jgi:hypothetical protein
MATPAMVVGTTYVGPGWLRAGRQFTSLLGFVASTLAYVFNPDLASSGVLRRARRGCRWHDCLQGLVRDAQTLAASAGGRFAVCQEEARCGLARVGAQLNWIISLEDAA